MKSHYITMKPQFSYGFHSYVFYGFNQRVPHGEIGGFFDAGCGQPGHWTRAFCEPLPCGFPSVNGSDQAALRLLLPRSWDFLGNTKNMEDLESKTRFESVNSMKFIYFYGFYGSFSTDMIRHWRVKHCKYLTNRWFPFLLLISTRLFTVTRFLQKHCTIDFTIHFPPLSCRHISLNPSTSAPQFRGSILAPSGTISSNVTMHNYPYGNLT